jgi:hypothetical protein
MKIRKFTKNFPETIEDCGKFTCIDGHFPCIDGKDDHSANMEKFKVMDFFPGNIEVLENLDFFLKTFKIRAGKISMYCIQGNLRRTLVSTN